MICKTLGRYKVLEQLGQGGMGEVYLADDTTLDRKVALKFLPEAFTSDPERMARFEREAKLLASLNHPNIAGIYGLEQVDGSRFLVLEYVEGETLQARLSKGALPLEEALELCRQMAEGLEAAHEKGVIHRDLKPANVMITAEEKVKILDFGLAKAFSDDTQSIDSSQSPTLTEAMTQPGVILGTAAYMSPEQAKGKSVDKRADIWAFGCILYECLTGKRAFEGETVTEMLAAILRGEPDWNRLPRNLHPQIRLLLERCLKKEPKNRYHDIADVRMYIQEVLADPRMVFVKQRFGMESQAKLTIALKWATVIILALAMGVIITWKLKPPEPRRVVSFDYHLPEDSEFTEGHKLAVSPDGSQFIYSTSKGLYIRFMDELQARLIPGTEGSTSSPFFSPDGLWVGYWSGVDNKLKKIPINGGVPEALCDANVTYGAIWYADNTIIYAEINSGVKRVSAKGGTPETLIEISGIVVPQLLPDGKSLLFTYAGSEPDEIGVWSLDSGEKKGLFNGFAARYLPTGHLVYSLAPESNVLRAVAFNSKKLEVTEEHIPVIEGAGQYFAISDSGDLVFIPQTTSRPRTTSATALQRTLVWMDREGNEEPLPVEPDNYLFCDLSPDGTKVALGIASDSNIDIWVMDLVNQTMPKLTFDEANDMNPLWTPDSKRVVFSSNRENGGIYWKKADGTGNTERLLAYFPERSFSPWSWSSDGKILVIQEMDQSSQQVHYEIGMLAMEGDRERTLLLQDEQYVGTPQVSPDGRWIAYTFGPVGSTEVFVRPFPDVNEGEWQVSTNGGMYPLWSQDGKEMFYRGPDGIMAVPVETEPVFQHGIPKPLFNKMINSYDIDPDGKRFLVIKPPERPDEESRAEEFTEEAPHKINIVTNWFEELKEKVPVD